MKIIFHTLVILVSAAVGLAIGSAWKSRTGSVNPNHLAAVSNINVDSNQSKNVKKKITVPPGDDSPLATQLQLDLSNSAGVAQWLHWMTALEKAQPVDFPRLAKLANGNPAAWRLIVTRWIEIAPRHLFDTLVAGNMSNLLMHKLGYELFRQWPKRDPDAAIAALSGVNPVGPLISWRITVAEAVVNNNAERGLDLMFQWHINNYTPSMGTIERWAAADPAHAAKFTLAHPGGAVSEATMETIGKEWAKTAPQAALALATSQPGELGSKLATAVLQEWASQKLDEAANWLQGTDLSTRSRLSPALVEIWAKQDAPSALAWCQENLQGLQLSQAVSGLMKGAAEKDLTGAAAIVTGMEPSAARAEAAGIVAKKWFPPGFDSSSSVKPEDIAWLSSLDGASIRRVLEEVTLYWTTSDPKSMARFLRAVSNDQVPPYTDSRLAREIARNSPREAIEWAASLPESRGITAGADAFAEWRSSQPDAAMSWLTGLPANDPRRQPFFEAMVQSLVYQTQAAEQLSLMSAKDQAIAQNIIKKMSLPDDQRDRLLNALKPR